MTRWFVPGRIEFLGKHTDYAGGPSLVCAIERGIVFEATPRDDTRVLITDARTGDVVEADLGSDVPERPGHWSNYFLTVCRRFGVGRGVDLHFTSDLPAAAGLSSSSALIVGAYLVLAHANGRNSSSPEALAEYLGAVESGVGTHGGSEDHTAMLCASPDALVEYRYAPIRRERTLPLPNDYVFVVASSGVAARKTGETMGLYNDVAGRARMALDAWRRTTGSAAPTLASALDEPGAMERFRRVLRDNDSLLGRVEQFHEEREIIRKVGDALQGGDLAAVGALVDRSQQNAERWLGNQTSETILLARAARALGAIAASAFGAGFGGSVYALVRDGGAREFASEWLKAYLRAFPTRAGQTAFFVTRAGPPARML